MKKWMAIVLAVAMMISMAACGSEAVSSTAPETTSAENSSVVDMEEASSAVVENSAEDETTAEEPAEAAAEEPVAESTTEDEIAAEEAAEEPEEVIENVTATDYMTIDGVFVDESYVDDDSDSIRMVYLFYTLTTPDENLRVDSKSVKMTFNGVNSYESSHYSGTCTYMPNYYYSDYLEDVYVGDSLKVVETLKIPVGELTEGNTITLTKSQVPDIEQITFSTDDIQFCDSPESIAAMVDPDGYALEVYNRTPADDATVSKVKAAINGYYWSVYVNSTSYELEFYDPNAFEMRVKAFGVSNSGTYEVLNGYVVCTYTETGIVLEIPYTWGANDIDLDVTTALDVKAG